VGGEGRTYHLPPGLPVDDYRGKGVLVDIFATAAVPHAGRGDCAGVTYKAVAQRGEGDFDIAQWDGAVGREARHTVKAGPVELDIAPMWHPQQLGTRLPSGQTPYEHNGVVDMVVRDLKGRPLGRVGLSENGWLTFAHEVDQPQGHRCTAVREGGNGLTHLDFVPVDGGAALFRLESGSTGSVDSFQVTDKEGDVHNLHFTHTVLRILPPGSFTTTQEEYSANTPGRDPH
jgi:hypothetical protein